MDLTALIEFTAPASVESVQRSPGGTEGDPWPGIDAWTAADYQAALDTLVAWRVPPPTGAAVHGNIAAYLASLPTPAEQDELRKDFDASEQMDAAVHKTVRDVLWDMELRIRAAGQASNDAGIAAAATKGDYSTVLKDQVKGYL